MKWLLHENRFMIRGVTVFSCVILLPALCLALDIVSTNIAVDTTWTVDDSPVNVDVWTLTVATNATLTIDPGVTVKFKGSLEVQGQLKAQGTPENRIVLDELNEGEGWGRLRFSELWNGYFRTNLFSYVDLTNMDSYIYISEQTVSFSNCTINTDLGWSHSYGIAAYVNKDINPARLTMVSNTVNIRLQRDYESSYARGFSIDGLPSDLIDNVISVTSTGRHTYVAGADFHVSNVSPFDGNFIGNTIVVSNSTEYDMTTYGIIFDSATSGRITNNTLTVYGPTDISAIKRYGSDPIADNRISLVTTWDEGYGELYGIHSQSSGSGENDLIVNNRVDMLTLFPQGQGRHLYGIYCQSGRVRGNRITGANICTNGSITGVCQLYYDGYIDSNTIVLEATNGVPLRGVDAATHYNTNTVIFVRNNIIVGSGDAGSVGIRQNTAVSRPMISNYYNLVFNMESNYSGCVAGVGAVSADPLFIDTNFHIAADSPAADAGTNLSWMAGATDMEGHVRIYNERVDMGADEFLSNLLFVAMSSAAPDPTKNSPVPVTVMFTDDVVGFTNTDITAGNASVDDFVMVSGSNYTFNLTPSGQGLVTADIAANVASNAADNGNQVASQFTRVYDSVRPDTAMSSSAGNPTNISPINVTVTFTEDVTGFTSDDIVPGNAAVGDFAAVCASNYTFTLTPAGQGEITANIAADVCQDSAGNNNTAAAEFALVYDSIAPTVEILSAAPDPTKTSPIPVILNFSEEILNFTNTDLSIGNGLVAGFTRVNATNYTFNLVPSGQGEVTVNIVTGTCHDAAGNPNEAACELSRIYDSVSPGVTLVSSSSDPTRDSPIVVQVNFTESVLNFTNTDLTLGNGSADNFVMVNSTNYVFDLTPSGDGEVTVDVAGGVCVDAADNNNTAADRFSITYDSAPPAPDPITWQTVPFAVDSGTIGMGVNAAADDNPPVQYLFENITGSSDSGWGARGWTNDGLNPNTLYEYRVRARDAAGNQADWSTTQDVYTCAAVPLAPVAAFDGLNVRVTLQASVTGGIYNADSNPSYTLYAIGVVTNSGNTNFVTLDGNVTNTPVWGGYTNWGEGSGVLVTNLDRNATNMLTVCARNSDGLVSDYGTGTNVTFDPGITIESIVMRKNGSGIVDVSVDVANPRGNDCSVSACYGYHGRGEANATNRAWLSSVDAAYGSPQVENSGEFRIEDVSTTAITNTITFAWPTQSGNNPVTLDTLHTGIWVRLKLRDESSGTVSPVAVTNMTVDNKSPWCTVARSSGTPTSESTLHFVISFGENVTGFQAGDVILSKSGVQGAINELTGSGSNYVLSVTGVSGNGTIGVSVGADVAVDEYGNGNLSGAEASYAVDTAAPGLSISGPSEDVTATGPVTYTVTYSGASSITLDAGDVTLSKSGSVAGTVSVSGNGPVERLVTVSGITGDGTLGISIAAGSASDAAGNSTSVATGSVFTVDNTAPELTITSSVSAVTASSPIPVVVNAGEAVTGLTADDVSVGNGSLSGFDAVSSSRYVFDVVPASAGTVTVTIDAGVASDAAGNGSVAAGFSRTYGLDLPGGVTASDGAYTGKVTVAWSAVDGATGYLVYRSTTDSSDSSSELGATTSTGYEDGAAEAGVTYYYRVKATNSVLVSAFSVSDSGYATAQDSEESERVPVYRLYSYGAAESTYEHLWTTNEGEKDTLDSWPSWQYEGIAWYAYLENVAETVPLYRLYAVSVKQHHYTIDAGEYDYLDQMNPDWVGEGIQYYVYASGNSETVPVYRFYHSGLYLHHFTIDEDEKEQIEAHPEWGYAYEGIGFYVFAANVESSTLDRRKKAQNTQKEDQYSRRYEPAERDASALDTAPRGNDDPAAVGGPLSGSISHLTFDIEHSVEVPGDYNGDGIEDVAYYEESSGQWLIVLCSVSRVARDEFDACPARGEVRCSEFVFSSGSPFALQPTPRSSRRRGVYSLLQWGGPGFVSVAGDYDGDGCSDLAAYHRATGEWFVMTLDGRVILWGVQWGGVDFDPESVDYDGDGLHDLCVRDRLSGRIYVMDISGRLQ